jgi:hypothetical protein
MTTTFFFDIGFKSGMAINLRADLQRLAGCVKAGRKRMQDTPAIAKPGDALAIEQMRIDPCHLRRDVGAHPHSAAGQLIDKLEGAQVKILPALADQRLDIFEQGRNDQFVAMGDELVEDWRRMASMRNASRGRTSSIASGNSQRRFGMVISGIP